MSGATALGGSKLVNVIANIAKILMFGYKCPRDEYIFKVICEAFEKKKIRIIEVGVDVNKVDEYYILLAKKMPNSILITLDNEMKEIAKEKGVKALRPEEVCKRLKFEGE